MSPIDISFFLLPQFFFRLYSLYFWNAHLFPAIVPMRRSPDTLVHSQIFLSIPFDGDPFF